MKRQQIIIVVIFLCILSSGVGFFMMGGSSDSENTSQAVSVAVPEAVPEAVSEAVPEAPETFEFTVPEDYPSQNECYMARYVDLRAAFGKNTESAGNHWNRHGQAENRNHTCTLSDEDAQCYIDRYPDAGTDLDEARKHYYETGMKEHRDFTCPPGVKELTCYVKRYPDLQNAFGTNYTIGMDWNHTLYKAHSHWHNHGKKEKRDISCP